MTTIPSKIRRTQDPNSQKGFTLIELLVTVLIIGILASIALPVLFGQVAKGRQAEAKTTLGAINRAQQAYRFEEATFTVLANLPITAPPGEYYEFSDDSLTADALGASQKAQARLTYTNDVFNYASAVGQTTTGIFEALVCEDNDLTEDNVSTTNTSGDIACSDGNQIN